MIPNNNLSVLPWYTSIEQQNARKWWIYDRIYPLFTPAMFMLPFQIMRENRLDFIPSENMVLYDSFNGAIKQNGESEDFDNYYIYLYDMGENPGVSSVYFENVPKPPIGHIVASAIDINGNIIGTFNPTFSGETFTGGWVLPENTDRFMVQMGVSTGDDFYYGKLFSAQTQILSIERFEIYTSNGQYVGNYLQQLKDAGLSIEVLSDYDVIVFDGKTPVFAQFADGQYYAVLSDGVETWYSEVFTVVNDISPYLKIEWWDNEDFVMDAGTIVYKYAGGTQFRNVLYLCADIGKPEYTFEEEGENRDGYFFPTKQISEKKYRFSFLASEYLLDVMRFIRMADYAYIEKNGQRYSLDTFLITPEWEDNGDVASVAAEFETATVAKKIGQGYIKAQRGDFNDDFNNDYNNQQ